MKADTDPVHPIDAEMDSPPESGIPATIRPLARLMDGCPLELAQSPEDLKAVAWMRQSLEDLEATIIGLSHSDLPHDLDHGQHQGRLAASLPDQDPR